MVKKLAVHIALLFCFLTGFAQIDTTFWFVAPEVSNRHGDRPIYLNLTTLNEAATITISMPMNTNFPEQIINLGANTTRRVDLTTWIDEIENDFDMSYDPTIPGKSNKAILIKSTAKITSYYEVARNNNCDLFSLKGKNALGSDFYVPFQNRFYNYNYNDYPRSSANIVFTEDDTYITIDIPVGKKLYTGGTPLTGTVRLGPFNAGETFHATPQSLTNSNPEIGRSENDHFPGIHIRAHDISGTVVRSIAITQSDDSMKSFWGGWDTGADQIVPIDIIGKEYVAIRGDLSSGNRDGRYQYQESVYITATEDNTQISVNGTNLGGSINKGEMRMYELSDFINLVKADKPIYVWQITGFGNEMGAAILPAVDKCTGSKSVSFTRSVDQQFKLIILVRSGAESSFTSNRNAVANKINSTSFSNVPGNSYWKAAKISFNASEIPVGQTTVIENSSDLFHIGIINGNSSGGTRYGYFSGFGDVPTINAAPSIDGYALCAGDMELSVIGNPYSTYQWYKNNTAIPGATSENYQVSEPGRYKVTAVTTCAGYSTETFPSNHVDAVPCIEAQDATVREGQPNAVVTVRMTHQMAFPISFEYATSDGTAVNGKDYTESRGTATIPANQLSVDIPVPITDDNFSEPNETINFTISNANVANINENAAIITIEDSPDIASVISIAAVENVNENVAGGKHNFIVSLNKESGYTVTADYVLSDGTAENGAAKDYTASLTGSLSFAPGETSKTIEITINNDNIYEPDPLGYETIITKIENIANATAGNSNGEIRIIDNEAIPSLTSADVIANEGTDLNFQLNLSHPCSENSTIDFQIIDITATNGLDFNYLSSASGTITFAPGELTKTVGVSAVDDGEIEIPENIRLQLAEPVNLSLASEPLNYTGTITDATGSPVLFVSDPEITEGGKIVFRVNTTIINTTANINFDLSINDGTALVGQDYEQLLKGDGTPRTSWNIQQNEAFRNIEIQTIDDNLTEGDETFSLTITPTDPGVAAVKDTGTGTIKDDDETPQAIDDNYSINEDPASALSENVLDNDNGLGDPPISVSFDQYLEGDGSGNLVLNNDGSFTYTPNADFNGTCKFTYIVSDRDNETSTGTVTITVNPVNDTPVAIDDNFTVKERTHPSYAVLNEDLKQNDTGLGDNALVVIVTNPTKGTVMLNPDNTISYEPNAQQFGNDQFTYKLVDADGQNSASATVRIHIDYYNEFNPVGVSDTYVTPEDTPLSFKPTENDTDQDGNSTIDVGSVIFENAPTKGTYTYNTGTGEYVYTPNSGVTGFENLRYKVKDRSIEGQTVRESAWTDLSIEIKRNVLPPNAVCTDFIAQLDADGKVTVTGDDIDGGSSDTNPGGSITTKQINGLNKIEYTCSDVGTHTVVLTVINDQGLQSTCNAEVTVVDNIAPTVNTPSSDVTVYCSAADAGATVNYTQPTFDDNCGGTGLNGSLIAGNSSGSFFSAAGSPHTVTYEYNDGNGNAVQSSFTVTVLIDNTAPVINCVANQNVNEDWNTNNYPVTDNSLDATASDANGIKSLVHDYAGGGSSLAGKTFPIGTTTVTWTATDNFDNISTCSYDIVVARAAVLSSDKVDDKACEGDMVEFTTAVTGGTSPYQYSLYINGVQQEGPQASNVFNVNSFIYDKAVPANNTKRIRIRVQDNSGNTVQTNQLMFTIIKKPETGGIYSLPNSN